MFALFARVYVGIVRMQASTDGLFTDCSRPRSSASSIFCTNLVSDSQFGAFIPAIGLVPAHELVDVLARVRLRTLVLQEHARARVNDWMVIHFA
jgi:hypothetical protein